MNRRILRRAFSIAVTIIIICPLSACYFLPQQQYLPSEGKWYSEDIQVQLSFDEFNVLEFYENKSYKYMSDEEYYSSFILIDGEKIRCSITCWFNSPKLFILYDDPRLNDVHSNRYGIGYYFYKTDVVNITENKMILKDRNTGQKYTFIRID